MTTTTKKPENEKRPATPLSEAMRAAWAKRRESAAMTAKWFAHPVCLCGCDGPLVRQKNPRKQHFFLQGHDSKLKALALKIVRGEASSDQIPDFTRDLKSSIKFLKKMPELRKAFE
jgi:hypothetical protein